MTADLQSGALGQRTEGRLQLGEATGVVRDWVLGDRREDTAPGAPAS